MRQRYGPGLWLTLQPTHCTFVLIYRAGRGGTFYHRTPFTLCCALHSGGGFRRFLRIGNLRFRRLGPCHITLSKVNLLVANGSKKVGGALEFEGGSSRPSVPVSFLVPRPTFQNSVTTESIK